MDSLFRFVSYTSLTSWNKKDSLFRFFLTLHVIDELENPLKPTRPAGTPRSSRSRSRHSSLSPRSRQVKHGYARLARARRRVARKLELLERVRGELGQDLCKAAALVPEDVTITVENGELWICDKSTPDSKWCQRSLELEQPKTITVTVCLSEEEDPLEFEFGIVLSDLGGCINRGGWHGRGTVEPIYDAQWSGLATLTMLPSDDAMAHTVSQDLGSFTLMYECEYEAVLDKSHRMLVKTSLPKSVADKYELGSQGVTSEENAFYEEIADLIQDAVETAGHFDEWYDSSDLDEVERKHEFKFAPESESEPKRQRGSGSQDKV